MIKRKQTRNEPERFCKDCALVKVETSFHTLSLEGRPTLGRCPHYTDGRYCVLLSQKACEHFKPSQNGTPSLP